MCKYENEINKLAQFINWGEKFKKRGQTITYNQFSDYLSTYAATMFRKHYYIDENGVHKKESAIANDNYGLPTIKMPCANVDEKFGGLYFVSMIGTNPNGKMYYLVKIGQAKNIASRMASYATHNPMIYHNYISLQIDDKEQRDKTEQNCHKFLAKFAYGVAQNSCEWFYVNEKDYFNICACFANHKSFQMIASGIKPPIEK